MFYLDLCMYSETLKKTKTVKATPKSTNTKAVSKEDWRVTKVSGDIIWKNISYGFKVSNKNTT